MSILKKIVVVAPWFGEFAGGAEFLARQIVVEFSKRGVQTVVLTTCCRSPYESWWEDYYPEGRSEVYGVETHRFFTNKTREKYEASIIKLSRGETLSAEERRHFFISGINSDRLVRALNSYLAAGDAVIALPYFQGLTHAVINQYPGQVYLTPCFHDEPQFYWPETATLLKNARHLFYNAHEEKI